MNEPANLFELEQQFKDYPFPHFVLENCDSTLILFCAGFYGGHDCLWVAKAGIKKVLGVDVNLKQLDYMKKIYPVDWLFKLSDITKDISYYGIEDKWNLVIADPPVSFSVPFLTVGLDKLCNLSNKYLVLTIPRNFYDYSVPKGWREVGRIYRSDTFTWLILGKQ